MKEEEFKILLAEDDDNLGNVLKTFLEAKGYKVVLKKDGQQAGDAFFQEYFDLCILDIMMPVKDGYTLAKEIRKNNAFVPLLFLTAKSMQEDIITGFHSGADDYITKPFSMEELLERIKAILRRTGKASESISNEKIYSIGNFKFDYLHQVLTFDNKEKKLTSRESELLKLLCDNINETVSRSLALKKIWENDSYFSARSMDVYITKLRKYLKKDHTIEIINVHGKGFKLITQ